MLLRQRLRAGGCMVGLPEQSSHFAELNALSWFSFLTSIVSPEELVLGAYHRGYKAIAITDECSLAGAVRAWQQSLITPINIIYGASFITTENLYLVALAKDMTGYQQLCRAISQARRQHQKKGYRIDIQQLINCTHCFILWRPTSLKAYQEQLQLLQVNHWRDRYVLITDELIAPNQQMNNLRQKLAHDHLIPVASCWPRMLHREQKSHLDLIDSIHALEPISKMGQKLAQNTERRLHKLETIRKRYHPHEQQAGLEIAAQCQFSLSHLRYQYPDDHAPAGSNADQYLRQLTTQGSRERFPNGMKAHHQQQLEKELKLIAELKYANYFLTIHDIITFARSRHILYQGRGSAANSIVCYLLHITEVDPEQVNLLFERFISKERREPPDIDVDFEHQRREEVIQYIYQKYGANRAALTATVITYRTRSALRDAGKALGISEWIIEQLTRLPDWRNKALNTQAQLASCQLLCTEQCQQLAQAVDNLRGQPRHLSQHVGGFVIAKDQLVDLVPIEAASMKGRSIIQWDKDDLESLGMMKVDILALGMLSAIRKTLDFIRELPHAPRSLSDIAKEDPKIYTMISQADTISVFQIESRAQMNMLPRLRPQCYYDLVIEVAIVRPGPIQGEMVHPYLLRRQHKQLVNYPNEAVKKVLQRTLGVPIFQEQVIQLAMVAAGFSAGEADQLRRAISSWKRHQDFSHFEQKLQQGLAANGYSTTFANRLIQQIRGFGGYGFPESHAASFALLVYFSAWLKYYYPTQFCAAQLNSQPMGFYSPAQLIQDAQRHGVSVLPIDISYSHWQHTIESGKLRLGLCLVKDLNRHACEAFLAKRNRTINQDDLPIYFDLTSQQALAKAGALQSLFGHRYQAHWEIKNLLPPLALFNNLPHPFPIQLPGPDEYQNIIQDYRYARVSLGRHPMAILRQRGYFPHMLNSHQLQQCHHGQLIRICGLVTGRQRPGSAADVTFVTLEDEFGQVNVIVWSATAKVQRRALVKSQLLAIHGIVEREERVIHVIAGKLIDETEKLANLPIKSRDFH
ncbi:error-prone DNA polymerase [Celerinatantimonas diazotrophica]|uniref:Error-prone DNA polymerase n=1 Tax=Celerinatantimonas diazotrophica TaxID=412034 RepID=A0A4R1JAM8_9GAMM|nr:error-prone DNA polymerase [Celerinatantimonas diazotrophica]TCK47703.1 DNA polymerase III alpha subunit [Celerinatantimonas diazotrophica]CAG9296673.1 Error-prone DNA polymerase [Celerinatantimonas diazotrophica]